MHIVNGIPTMEMKADSNAQAWARSAKNVLTITNESIAETLTEANTLAKNQGTPLFCLPENIQLDASTLKPLIEEAYQTMPRAQSDKDRMTVSQVAWIAVTQRFPCQPMHHTANNTANAAPMMQHEE